MLEDVELLLGIALSNKGDSTCPISGVDRGEVKEESS